MLGIASAPDFTEKLIWHPSGEAQKKEWRDNGVVYAPSCYGEEPYPITRLLIEEARQHLMMDKPIPIAGPIRLMHGIADRDVPWQLAVEWMQHMASTDSSIELIKDGDHRLSAPKHLEILCRIAGNMLDTV
jgi:alpha-beta hydrolase superfamily lysophospholipase